MNVQAKIAEDKRKNPERFCPYKNCLWRTSRLLNSATGERTPGGHCPRHGGATCPECGKTKHVPGRVNPTGKRGGWQDCANDFHNVQQSEAA